MEHGQPLVQQGGCRGKDLVRMGAKATSSVLSKRGRSVESEVGLAYAKSVIWRAPRVGNGAEHGRTSLEVNASLITLGQERASHFLLPTTHGGSS